MKMNHKKSYNKSKGSSESTVSRSLKTSYLNNFCLLIYKINSPTKQTINMGESVFVYVLFLNF